MKNQIYEKSNSCVNKQIQYLNEENKFIQESNNWYFA